MFKARLHIQDKVTQLKQKIDVTNDPFHKTEEGNTVCVVYIVSCHFV